MPTFKVTGLSQFRYIGRIMNDIHIDKDQCILSYSSEGFTTTLRPQLHYCFKYQDDMGFELITQKDKYKLIVRFLCTRTSSSWDIHDLKLFGLHRSNTNNSMWSSIIISPVFEVHLKMSANILKTMFNRIHTFHTMENKFSHTVKGKFIQKIQQPCNAHVSHILRKYMVQRRLLCQFRNNQLLKRVWYTWLLHYYAPDTHHGYMARYLERHTSMGVLVGNSVNSA
jgi:hypothetical protein